MASTKWGRPYTRIHTFFLNDASLDLCTTLVSFPPRAPDMIASSRVAICIYVSHPSHCPHEDRERALGMINPNGWRASRLWSLSRYVYGWIDAAEGDARMDGPSLPPPPRSASGLVWWVPSGLRRNVIRTAFRLVARCVFG